MPKTSNAGRPTKMTEATVKKLDEAFAVGCSDLEACLYAGISKQTLYNYQDENPEYIDRKEKLKQNLKMHSKFNLGKSITKEKDVDDSKWYLERKCKDEFSTKSEQDITSKGEQIKDATHVLLAKIPQDILEKTLEEVEAVTNTPTKSNETE